MPTYERLDYGSPDGSHWGGASTDALGMYGVTPVTQYTAVGAASTYSTTSTSNAVQTTYGFTQAGVTSIILQVSTMVEAGRRLGLWV
jgi:transcription elongation factor